MHESAVAFEGNNQPVLVHSGHDEGITYKDQQFTSFRKTTLTTPKSECQNHHSQMTNERMENNSTAAQLRQAA